MKILDAIRLKMNGCGRYGQAVFLIHGGIFGNRRDVMEKYMHMERSDGDYLVGIFEDRPFIPCVIGLCTDMPKIVSPARYIAPEDARRIEKYIGHIRGKTKNA